MYIYIYRQTHTHIYTYISILKIFFDYLSIKVKTIKPELITQHSLDLNLFCVSHGRDSPKLSEVFTDLVKNALEKTIPFFNR